MPTAGCRTIELFDTETGTRFPALVLYPSSSPETCEHIGPFDVEVAMNGAVEDGAFGLVVISHGSGGSHLVYRTLGAHLARNGFVVVSPEHPGNNRNNNELASSVANLSNRPRHLRIAIDWAYASPEFGPRLRSDAVAVVGHSMGGYTALALAGGRPSALRNQSPVHADRRVEVQPDSRVRALVLLAPATPWFMAPEALAAVRVPVLMLTAEHDTITPEGHAEIVKRGLPPDASVEHRVIPGAGHFSFLSPFPEHMSKPSFAPSQDPAGFNRRLFHEELGSDVLTFLRRVL